MEQDAEKLKKMEEEVTKSSREKYLSKFNAIILENGGQFLVGKKMTWADIYFAQALNNGELIHGTKFTEEYPGLKAMYDNVFNTPAIKKWVKGRPSTKF